MPHNPFLFLRAHQRVLICYLLWTASVIAALFSARAFHLDFSAGWGDPAANHWHVILWRETAVLIAVSIVLTVLLALVSRRAIYSVAGIVAILCTMRLIGSHSPQTVKVCLFMPQLPGFFAAIFALGIHDDSNVAAWWMVAVNTMLYAPILFFMLSKRAARRRESQ